MNLTLDTTGASEPDHTYGGAASGDHSYGTESRSPSDRMELYNSSATNHSGASEAGLSRRDDPVQSDRSLPSELSYQSSEHEEPVLQTPEAFTSPKYACLLPW